MKKLLLPLILLFLLPLSLISAKETEVSIDPEVAKENAQPVVVEDTEKRSVKSTNRYFELELIQGSQSAFNKNISYVLKITPKIDSPKTQIIWDTPSTLVAKPRHSEFVNLNKDQTYTFNVNIAPQRGGTYDIATNVISWLPEGNFTNSVSSTITLSNSLLLQPISAGYTLGLLAIFLGIILAIGGVIFAGFKMSDKLIARIKIWLTPPV